LGLGGLAVVTNPFDIDFNAGDLLDQMEDGMYDGIELIGDFAGDIDIGDLCDEAIGEITDQVADLDIPDIDFGEF
jgi:hypothetical protein